MPPPPSRIHTYCACAIANGIGTAFRRSAQQSASLISRFALFRRATMPLGIGVMRAAEPLVAVLAKLLSALIAGFIHARHSLTSVFLRLYGGGSGHGVLLGNGAVARKGVSGWVSPHPLCSLHCTQYTPVRPPLQPYCAPFRPRREYLCAPSPPPWDQTAPTYWAGPRTRCTKPCRPA